MVLVNTDYKEERKSERAMGFNLIRKREVERSETGEFNTGELEKKWRDEQRDVGQTGDSSIKQEQHDRKICLQS